MRAERLTPLDCRFLDDHGVRPQWTLLMPLEYYSELLDERLSVPAGFVTDFASVPRVAFAYIMYGGHATWEAVIHDYLYRVRSDLSREVCDAVFLEAMESDGEPTWRRQVMYYFVKLFGAR